ncbi:MAG: hypothetical protein QXF45_00370 [Candidatus Caldarchaeum sp.]
MTYSDKAYLLKLIETTFQNLKDERSIDFQEITKQISVDYENVIETLRGLLGQNHPPGFIRVSLGLAAISLGAEPEKIARQLSWREMEIFVAHACHLSGLMQRTNVRLSFEKKRVELDVVAASTSLCLVFDCKRWNKRLAGKTLNTIVEKHKQRTIILKQFFEKNMSGRKLVFFTPVIVSLYEPSSRKASDIYIVPVNSLKSFLQFVENVLGGEVYTAHLDEKWTEFFARDNLNQSLENWR